MTEQTKENQKDKLKILAAGDIHGDSKLSQKLAERAEKENVDLVILTGDIFGAVQSKNIIKPFIDKKRKVIFVPGNWETKEESEKFSKEYGIKDIGNQYLRYKNVGIFGIGNPDWDMFPNKKKTFDKLKSDSDRIRKLGLEKQIMISHVHAAGTKSELSGIPGSLMLRRAIEQLQPDMFIHSHIHELAGAEEKIGKTKVVNVGRLGRIFEV